MIFQMCSALHSKMVYNEPKLIISQSEIVNVHLAVFLTLKNYIHRLLTLTQVLHMKKIVKTARCPQRETFTLQFFYQPILFKINSDCSSLEHQMLFFLPAIMKTLYHSLVHPYLNHGVGQHQLPQICLTYFRRKTYVMFKIYPTMSIQISLS